MKKISIWLAAFGCVITVGFNGQRAVPVPGSMVLRPGPAVMGVKTIISGLDVPWQIIWGPDNKIWMTEQNGAISKVDPETGERKVLLQIPDVYKKKSYGLLGMALAPDFKQHPYVFVDYTYLKPEALTDTARRDASILSKLVRYTYSNGTLTGPVVLLDKIPGNTYHNGCRVIIAPDGKIMMTTGDAGHKSNAQNTSSLSGKVLRLNMDGTIPADNPIAGSPVWSWGHRNSEGLAFAENGILYNSENGDATDDEINIIEKGANYGWPDVEGYCDKPAEITYCRLNHITEPIKAWTPTIAPAGLVYYNSDHIPEWKHSLLMGTLKGNSLRVLKLDKAGIAITQERVYFEMELGRIRSLCVSPAGDVYLSTSNRDWNPAPGFPKTGDDRIVKLTRISSVHQNTIARVNMPLKASLAKLPAGSRLYMNYCASCHKPNGKGVAGTFPPLSGSEYVTGSKGKILSIVVKGLNGAFAVKGIKYNQEMPSFAFMSDEEIRLVVNCVRTNFGNHAQLITLADVKKARKIANGRH